MKKSLCNLWSMKLVYGIVGTYSSKNQSPFFGASVESLKMKKIVLPFQVKLIFFKYRCFLYI